MTWVILAGLVLAGCAMLLRMVPTQAIAERAFVLLGADTTTLNKSSGTANILILFTNAATPGPNMVVGDFTEATFTGYAAKPVLADGLPESVDPTTGDILISFPGEAVSYLWEVTGGGSLPQTIYGYAIFNQAKSAVYAAQRLATPIVLSAVNQSFSIAIPNLRLANGAIT